MAASLIIGLRRLAPAPDSTIVISTVDCLPVRHSTLSALLRAVLADEVEVATPSYQGRGGHPVVARESLLRNFLSGYPGTLRDLLRVAEAQRDRLEVDDPDVVGDLDTPADLAAASPGLDPYFARALAAP